MKVSRWFVAIIAVMALVAAACGDDDDDAGSDSTSESTSGGSDTTADTGGNATDTTTGATNEPGEVPANLADAVALVQGDPLFGTEGSGQTRGVTDDSIKVACIAEVAFYAGADDGYRARFERANAEGGVHGRMIDFSSCEDDASDTDRHNTIARRMVQQDDVFAIMTQSAAMPPSTADFLNEEEVPYFGWGFINPYCGTRWGFGFNGCLNGIFTGPERVPHPFALGGTADSVIAVSGLEPADVRFASIAADSDAGRAGNDGYDAIFSARGAEVVYLGATIPVPGPTTDFTPFVQDALGSDPNILFIATAFGDVGGLSAALSGAGYEGINLNFVAYVPGLLDAQPQLAQALEGTYINTHIVPQEQQTAYIAMVEDDLVASESESGDFITFGAALAYQQADLFVQMLEAAGPDLNTQTFDQAVNGGGFVYSSPAAGGPCSLPFPEGHFVPADGNAIVRVVDGAFEVAEPYACYTPLAAG